MEIKEFGEVKATAWSICFVIAVAGFTLQFGIVGTIMALGLGGMILVPHLGLQEYSNKASETSTDTTEKTQ